MKIALLLSPLIFLNILYFVATKPSNNLEKDSPQIINNNKYTHLCLNEKHDFFILDPKNIKYLDISGKDYDVTTNDNSCSMRITKKYKFIKKTQLNIPYFEVLFSTKSNNECVTETGNDIICDRGSNCTDATICLPPPIDHVTNSFAIYPIVLYDDHSIFNGTKQQLIYDGGNEKCSFTAYTRCYSLMASSTNNIISSKVLLIFGVLSYLYF